MGLGVYWAAELCARDFLFPSASYKKKHVHVKKASLFELETTCLNPGLQNILSWVGLGLSCARDIYSVGIRVEQQMQKQQLTL